MRIGTPRSLIAPRYSTDESAVAKLATQAFLDLHGYVAAVNHEGWEFDDLLASKAVNRACFNSLLAKRVAIQIGMRLPTVPRRLLGVPKLPSTKAAGFFARGYLRYFEATGEQRWMDEACRLLDWLLENPSVGFQGISWGNHFDFASRGGMFPAGLPTVVWTAHIAETFRLADSLLDDDRYSEVDHLAAEFVYEALGEVPQSTGTLIPYAPGLASPIHNSNLLGAVLLARAGTRSNSMEWIERSKRSFAWSLSNQEANGGWMYGTGEKYGWIDNFHTAYVIDALIEGHSLLGEEVVPQAQIDSSVDYWTKTFFSGEGLPAYYSNRIYPINIQCASQAIETLTSIADSYPKCALLASKVLNWTVVNMQRPDGGYRYKINRFATNDLSSIHWGEATMLSALGTYCASFGTSRV